MDRERSMDGATAQTNETLKCQFSQDTELPFDPIWLRFKDPEFESKAWEAFFDNIKKTNKKSVPIAMFLWIVWFLIDYAFDTEYFRLMAISRSAGVVVGMFCWITASQKQLDHKITIGLWGFAGFSLCSMTALNTCFNRTLSTAGVNLLIVGTNVFVDLPFFAMLVINCGVPLFYGFILRYVGQGEMALVLSNTTYVFGTCLVLTVNAYFKEVYFRREFRLKQLMLQQWQMRAEEAIELSKVSRLAADAKSRFLAVMSHEMRSPLNGIHAMTELLMRSDLSPDDKESVVIIQRSSELLLALISDVLDVSRLEKNTIKLVPERVDIFELVEDVLSLCESEVYKHEQLELFANFRAGIPRHVFVDKNRLKQIILNLSWNAVKFCHQGFVSIEVSVCERVPTDPEIDSVHAIQYTEELQLTGPCLVIAVRDSGVGINSEDLPHVFQEFWQKDTSSTRKYNGAGLGLSICKRLLESMKGQLSARSCPQVTPGTTFTVYLPLSHLNVSIRPMIPGSPHYSDEIHSHQQYMLPPASPMAQTRSRASADCSANVEDTVFFRGDIKICEEVKMNRIGSFALRQGYAISRTITTTLPKLAVFVNQSFECASVLSNYLANQGYSTRVLKTPSEVLPLMEEQKERVSLALVFLDSNTSKNELISLHDLSSKADTESSPSSQQSEQEQEDSSNKFFQFGADQFRRRQSISVNQDDFLQGPQTPFFPFVFVHVTSNANRAHTADLVDCGFSLQITKPVKIKSLIKVMNFGEEAIVARSRRGSNDTSSGFATPIQHSSRITTFEFPPRSSEQLHIPPQKRPQSAQPRSPIRVLVVDDNPTNVRVLQKILSGDKYQVSTARDGFQAIQAVDSNDQFDLILMDLHMPNCSGIEATMSIRARTDSKKDTPIVALSADVFQEMLDEAFKAGATEFQAKPIKIQELFSTIERLVPPK